MQSKLRLELYMFLIIIIIIGGYLLLTMNKDSEPIGIVISTDNTNIIDTGLSKLGGQFLEVKILNGKYKDSIINVNNELLGKLDFDTIYDEGDKLVVALYLENSIIRGAKAIDFYRINWEIGLVLLFFALLILFAKAIGIKAIISFVLSTVIICKVYIPLLIKNYNPILLTIFIIAMLSGVILFSIAGFTKKGLVAFLGTISGLAITLIVTLIFGSGLRLYGYTSPFSETLLFSGHLDLDIRGIFYSAIILGASGAAMDISIDIAASMEEIRTKIKDIGTYELIKSGVTIGRDVIGTMTTTLLLAYSGGYLTLLMLFYSKGTDIQRLLNLKIIAAEIMRILVGSIGLVVVAPITAFIGGVIYTGVYDWKKKAYK